MQNAKQKDIFFINFENVSAETHEKVLGALKAELDEARAQNRIPIWEKCFEHFAHYSNTIN